MKKRGYLVLENINKGTPLFFEGEFFGYELPQKNYFKLKDKGYGEVVFNTSMTGYQEILTDPSYYGQIITFTHPHIGNTGVNLEDPESINVWTGGIVVHDYSELPSSWRAKKTLENYLIDFQTPAMSGVDTRALTGYLRTVGVARGFFIHDNDKQMAQDLLSNLPDFEGRDLIQEVTTKESYVFKNNKNSKFKVVAIDFGIKKNLLTCLQERNCEIEVVSATTTAQEILNKHPNGVFLSNGPGDPSAANYAAKTVLELVGKVPIFGVCMGHQILALAMGAKTYKLKFGHRGGNQPVLDSSTQKVEISSHNHGYSVSSHDLPSNIHITHLNLNDKTVEGLEIKGENAFSVQYHPEACPGPHDSMSLFDKFTGIMESQCTKNI